MAEHEGIDFWNYVSPSKKSLRKAFDVYYPYIAKEKVWPGPQIKDFDYEEAYPFLIAGAKNLIALLVPIQLKKLRWINSIVYK